MDWFFGGGGGGGGGCCFFFGGVGIIVVCGIIINFIVWCKLLVLIVVCLFNAVDVLVICIVKSFV